MANVTIHQHKVAVTVEIVETRTEGSWFCVRLGDGITIYLEHADAKAIANARAIAAALTGAADKLQAKLDAQAEGAAVSA